MNEPRAGNHPLREAAGLGIRGAGADANPGLADSAPDAPPFAPPSNLPGIRGRRCPVCEGLAIRLFASIGCRDYLRCGECEATFLHPDQRPAPEREFAEYRLHRNRIDDPAYRGFLRPVADLVNARLAPGSHGLDYGCGPAPALASMLRETGHRVALYDPFFRADRSVLECTYDFIACTETAEHFHEPAEDFKRLATLLKPGGWIAIQTRFQTDDAAFARWNYRRDPTHVVFYRASTFRQLARTHDWITEFPAPNLACFRSRPA